MYFLWLEFSCAYGDCWFHFSFCGQFCPDQEFVFVPLFLAKHSPAARASRMR